MPEFPALTIENRGWPHRAAGAEAVAELMSVEKVGRLPDGLLAETASVKSSAM
jgi:hypothetical protein